MVPILSTKSLYRQTEAFNVVRNSKALSQQYSKYIITFFGKIFLLLNDTYGLWLNCLTLFLCIYLERPAVQPTERSLCV